MSEISCPISTGYHAHRGVEGLRWLNEVADIELDDKRYLFDSDGFFQVMAPGYYGALAISGTQDTWAIDAYRSRGQSLLNEPLITLWNERIIPAYTTRATDVPSSEAKLMVASRFVDDDWRGLNDLYGIQLSDGLLFPFISASGRDEINEDGYHFIYNDLGGVTYERFSQKITTTSSSGALVSVDLAGYAEIAESGIFDAPSIRQIGYATLLKSL